MLDQFSCKLLEKWMKLCINHRLSNKIVMLLHNSNYKLYKLCNNTKDGAISLMHSF